MLSPGDERFRNKEIPPTPTVDSNIIERIEKRSPTQPKAIVPKIIASPYRI